MKNRNLTDLLALRILLCQALLFVSIVATIVNIVKQYNNVKYGNTTQYVYYKEGATLTVNSKK